MDLVFDFDGQQSIVNARFDGLDGSESVTSVKDALALLKIRNPAINFAEAVRSGAYDKVSDAEYHRMLETIEFIQKLWRYTDEPEDAPTKYEMNPLMLLANALEALSRFNVQDQREASRQP